MYKNAHLQNITPESRAGLEETEILQMKAGLGEGRRRRGGEGGRLFVGFLTGMVLIMWDQNKPSTLIKAFSSPPGSPTADPRKQTGFGGGI